MPSWWRKFSKEVKKSNRESIIDALHMTCIRPGAPRRRHSDTSSEKVSQSGADSPSPSHSKIVSRYQSFRERPQAQPLTLPHSRCPDICHADSGKRASIEPSLDRSSKTSVMSLPKSRHVKIGQRAVVGERDLTIASSFTDSNSDTDDPSDSRLLSPQASDYENSIKSDTTTPSGLKQRYQTPFANKKKNSKEILKPANILVTFIILESTFPFIFSTALDEKINAWLYENLRSRVDYDAPGCWCTTMVYSREQDFSHVGQVKMESRTLNGMKAKEL